MPKRAVWAVLAVILMFFGVGCSGRAVEGSAVAPEPTLTPVHCDLIFPAPSAG